MEKIDKNWEDGELLFTKATVHVSANTAIRNIGSSDKTKITEKSDNKCGKI